MYYDDAVLLKLSESCDYKLNLAYLGPRMKRNLVSALRTGVMTNMRGTAATTFGILTDAYKLPSIAFSSRTVGHDYTHIRYQRLSPECAAPLVEWWNADRSIFRMENSDKYNQFKELANRYGRSSWYNRVFEMPNWEHNPAGICAALSSQSTFHLDMLCKAMLCLTDTDEYKEKVSPIINLVQSSGSIILTVVDSKIVGVR